MRLKQTFRSVLEKKNSHRSYIDTRDRTIKFQKIHPLVYYVRFLLNQTVYRQKLKPAKLGKHYSTRPRHRLPMLKSIMFKICRETFDRSSVFWKETLDSVPLNSLIYTTVLPHTDANRPNTRIVLINNTILHYLLA